MKQRMMYKYIHVDLCNPDVANKLYTNLNREVNNMGDFPLKFADSGIKYRGYIIHKKIYQSYLLFYIISDRNQASKSPKDLEVFFYPFERKVIFKTK